MTDNRTLHQKILAMANQTASPNEARIARAILSRLRTGAGEAETPRVLGREDILATADRDSQRQAVRVKYGGVWVTFDDLSPAEMAELRAAGLL